MNNIDYSTKKYICLEDFGVFIKNKIYDINPFFAESYKIYGAKLSSIEEWREQQINKILNNV